MTPVTRSLQFFGFFAFHGRASTVFGPRVYLLFTGVYDTRMAVFVALLIIVGSTLLLPWVDPE
jgi:MFS-type transporter involved in bile tolerance (Atg22 family)